MSARSKGKWGGKRPGAGRKPSAPAECAAPQKPRATPRAAPAEATAPEQGSFDPDVVLRQIASDPKAPASARVAAAKALRIGRRKHAVADETSDDDRDPVRQQATEILQRRRLQ
jgi:hypothetical protein